MDDRPRQHSSSERRIAALEGRAAELEEALERREQDSELLANRFRDLQHRAKIAYWMWSFETSRVEFWSEGASAILDIPAQDLLGSYEAYLEMVHPDDRERVRGAYSVEHPDQPQRTGYTVDYRLITPKNNLKDIHETAEVQLGADSEQVGLVGIIQDVTERKRYEQFSFLGHLVATVAHELRGPLATIDANVQLLERTPGGAPPEVMTKVRRMGRASSRCKAIVDELLASAQDRASILELVDIDGWLGEVLDGIEIPSGIRCERRFEAMSMQPIDRHRLEQAVSNLVRNSCDAMAANIETGGAATITVSSRTSSAALEIEVADTGPGIPVATRRQMFEPLYSTKPSGFGLGLPLVQRVAQAHQGRVEVKSRVGEGTKVAIVIPIRPQP